MSSHVKLLAGFKTGKEVGKAKEQGGALCAAESLSLNRQFPLVIWFNPPLPATPACEVAVRPTGSTPVVDSHLFRL